MVCVYLHVSIMAPHRKEMSEELRNLIVRLQKDGKGCRKIFDQLKANHNHNPRLSCAALLPVNYAGPGRLTCQGAVQCASYTAVQNRWF